MDTTLQYMRFVAAEAGFEQVRPDGRMEHTADRRIIFESGYTYGECWGRLSREWGTHREDRETLAEWRVGATMRQRSEWSAEFRTAPVVLDTNARAVS